MSQPNLVPTARCPQCQTPPALRLYPELVELAESVKADVPLLTVQCKRRTVGYNTCNRVFDVTAGAIRNAYPVRAAA